MGRHSRIAAEWRGRGLARGCQGGENFWNDVEEWSGGHLILGYKVEDVAITGEGTIDGSGLSFFGECDFPVESQCNATDWSIRDIAFERCRFSSLRPAIFRGDAERHPENVVFRGCSREHLDHLKVRHHPGYGDGRPDTFMEIEGVADLRIEPGGR